MTTLIECPICGEEKPPFELPAQAAQYIALEYQVEGICQDCFERIQGRVDFLKAFKVAIEETPTE
jgi:hypothetical protein